MIAVVAAHLFARNERRATKRMLAAASALMMFVVGVDEPPDATATPSTHLASVVPARILETRSGPATADGQFAGAGPAAAGSTLEVQVAGRGGVPSDAQAVMLNVTAVAPSSPGFLTVYPCGNPRPVASNLNFLAGEVVANAVLTKLGSTGKVCIYTAATTDVVADVNGYVPAGGSFGTIVPARLLETRPAFTTADGHFEGTGPLAGGTALSLRVAGRGGIPDDAAAVMLNVTAVSPEADGFVTVFPCGTPRPTASNVNYRAGEVVPNAVLSKIGSNGAVCIYTRSTTDLVVDASGHIPLDGSFGALIPARMLETRQGLLTIDGSSQGVGHLPAEWVYRLQITGRGGVPADAAAVLLNVTAVAPSAPGFVTVYPCGSPLPNASNVNYGPGDAIANAVLAQVGDGGTVCVYTKATTDMVVDVNGYVPAGTAPGGCDTADIVPLLDGTIEAARLAPGDAWATAFDGAAFAGRTNTAEEFAARLAFDCAARLTQQAGGDERLALVAWNDLRHAYVIQATDGPTTPYAPEARFQLFVEQPYGEWIDHLWTWAATMSGGESIVIGADDYSMGVTAKSWLSDVPRFEDLPITNEAEAHAIDVLRNAGARNVSVAEPAHGSPMASIQMNTPDALVIFAGVAPAEMFDPFVPLVDEMTTYYVVDGVDVRASYGRELEFSEITDVGFSCHDYGWRLTTSLGTPDEVVAFATTLIQSHDC